MEELLRFLKSIGYTNEQIDGSIDKVVYKSKEDKFIVYIRCPKVLEIDIANSLFLSALNGINGNKKCEIKLIYEEVTDEDIRKYLDYFLDEIIINRPSLLSIKKNKLVIDDGIIYFQVANSFEKGDLQKESKVILNRLEKYGLGIFDIEIDISEENRKNIQEEIKSDFNNIENKEKEVSPIIMGFHKDGEVTRLNNIMGEAKNVIAEVFVFGKEVVERQGKKGPVFILNVKISDKSDSYLMKIVRFNAEEFYGIEKRIKEGNWYRIHGHVEKDQYLNQIIFNARNIEEIPSKDVKIKDEAEIKRVELHAHTMMSTMDGVIDAKKLMKYAVSLGHKAVAVTDHNAVQAYPDLFHAVCDYNKGKEGNDRFKVLYGAELNVVNDDIDFIYNLREYPLTHQEYIVFDTETTGLYAGMDQMIEIGAVKIKDGEVLDTFDELIDPGKPISNITTELTNITDEMLKGKEHEDVVTQKFLDWVGNLPMVAHNAAFDIGFISAACKKYNLKEFDNTVLDTMNIARMLHPEWGNHKLTNLARKYNVDWNEDEHHRADYDALGTGKAFCKMCEELVSQNIDTTTKLFNTVDINEIIKFSHPSHLCCLVQNKTGLKNLFKIISYANTTYLFKNSEPKLPKGKLKELREGLLIGSGCINGEIFEAAMNKDDEELASIMQFYDYIEVQPISAMKHLIQMESSGFKNLGDLIENVKKIVRVAKMAGKIVVATGDVHYLTPDDKIYRDIIIAQKTGGKLHPLNRKGIETPDMHFRTTKEMLEEFSFLGEDVAYEIVVTNTNKIADMIEEVEVIIQTGGVPFSPKIDNSVETMTELVYTKAASWYGDPLPFNIEERISKELYGDAVLSSIKSRLIREEKLEGEKLETESFKILHDTIIKGFDEVKRVVKEEMLITKSLEKEKDIKEMIEKISNAPVTEKEELNNELEKIKERDINEDIDKQVKKALGGIIGGGFDVIYLIAQKLVKKSNDDGFLVGSRGSVGSSLVATMMGITEVNALPPHYRCKNCKNSIFEDENGVSLGSIYNSGFDLPDKACPKCGSKMVKDGQDMPFATFLGFNADKVPDIDLNFSDLNQAAAHEYTKVLFGIDNVYRAGTIGTVADKTAMGYVRGYAEAKNIYLSNLEVERLAIGCTGVKRTTGQHPGGIVVIPGYMDVFDFTPYQYPAEDIDAAWRTTHFDYHAIDEDVLKLDILGHTDPTQLRMIQDISGIDVTTIPLDDKDTMGIFLSPEPLGVTKDQIMNETGTLGVPEFGTPFTISMLVDTKPKTFAELIKISGLSHGTDVWLGNAQELIRNNVVPFSNVIGCRDDIMVYLMHKGLEPIKAFKIMEFVRKGKASKDHETWLKHKETMEQAGIEEWFIDSCGKIKYMFPKAHAAAYVMSAFRIAYFKVHYPGIYYSTYFSTRFDDFDLEVMVKGYDAIKAKIEEIKNKGYNATNKEASVLETLKLALEATARGYKFAMIDLIKSDGKNFVIDAEDEHTLICPFRTLDGLGESVANKIIEERDKKPFYCIEDFATRAKVNQTTVIALKNLGIFKDLPESAQLSLF